MTKDDPLVAAAPELLETLEAVCMDAQDASDLVGAWVVSEDLLNQAREVIAKARGETA